MERYRPRFPKRITIEDWLAKAHPDLLGLPWVSDRGEEICSFTVRPLEETGGIQATLFDAHGREVVMTGSPTAIEQTAVALGAVPGELTFLPKATSRQAPPIGAALRALYAAELNVSLQSFWDCGWRVRVGDELNGFAAECTFGPDEFDKIGAWLLARIVEHPAPVAKHEPEIVERFVRSLGFKIDRKDGS